MSSNKVDMSNVEGFYDWMVRIGNVYLFDHVEMTRAFDKLIVKEELEYEQ